MLPRPGTGLVPGEISTHPARMAAAAVGYRAIRWQVHSRRAASVFHDQEYSGGNEVLAGPSRPPGRSRPAAAPKAGRFRLSVTFLA